MSYLEAINLNINQDEAEAIAGPFFGASLLPYLAFLYFLNVEENDCPKGRFTSVTDIKLVSDCDMK
eukprot:11147335-Ditylum_brightwellii.AAC.1